MDLSLELDKISGIGPKTYEKLEKAGLRTLGDLIYYLPRAYENYRATTTIDQIRPGKVMIKGKPDSLKSTHARRRHLTITEGVIRDNTGAIRVVWFNQPYRARQLDPKKEYYFTGNYDFKYGKYQLTSPVVTEAAEVSENQSGFQPIYPAKNSLKPLFFKKFIGKLRPNFASIPDLLPTDYAPDFAGQGARAAALYDVHFPETPEDVKKGKNYLAYEELFEFLLAARLNQQENQKLNAIKLPFNAENTKNLVKNLPFKLTQAQRIATWDILRDLEKPVPMNRLLQGDVGSGKTVVAALAAHQAAKSGHQTAILAPTAILASQHASGLSALLEPFGLKIALLTGATKQKASLKKQIKNGEIDIIIGTHALLTDDTVFHSLALCIIDEQHRFGVAQRQKLLAKSAISNPGFAPHLLSMTATPIPRSLQLTVFGDLDISILDSLPNGRQPIETKIMPEIEMQENLYPALRQHLKAGEQVYFICRLIDENDAGAANAPASSAADIPISGSSRQRERTIGQTPVTTGWLPGARDGMSETSSVVNLQTGNAQSDVISLSKKIKKLFPEYSVATLHGKMRPAEKDAVMEKFLKNEAQILVSTTVVEVGVNVPNATQIVIMDADGYGLAQLHQLRGRVGRGSKASNCYLITSGEDKPSRRLRELEKSTDGFYLSEVDLKLRGPGEIYGSLQHGELNLQIATLSDTKLIALARKHATEFAKHPEGMVKYKELNNNIKKYQQLTTLN